MKINYLIKALPFFSTLLLIIFLSISNQKEYTKLKILIWNTPSVSIGTYLAISSGTGFIFSYLITTNLAKVFQASKNKPLNFRDDSKYEKINDLTDTATKAFYENILIERDIKDPSPTINASFRIIGRREISNTNFINNDNVKCDDSIGFEELYDEELDNNETINKVDHNSIDWNDESYSRW